jgi:methyl-accepting chemotaxis protein
VRRLLLIAASLALAGCNGGTVDRHALTKDGEAIDSLACEGRLLAREVADGDGTSRFTRVHADELRQRASNFEDALSERPTVAGIERDVRALARKAGRIASLLGHLHRQPEDRATARRLEPLLAEAGDCR